MNNLEKIWLDQQEFNQQFQPDFSQLSLDTALSERTRITKELILHLISELTEILDNLNWKIHKNVPKHLIKSNLAVELIDTFKFWMSLAILWGYTPEEIFEEYWKKSKALQLQIDQEKWLKDTQQPLIILDIDGVLASYEEAIKKAANITSLNEQSVIERLKLKQLYRDTLGMMDMDQIPDSQEFTRKATQLGYGIILLTARPKFRFKRLLGDTVEWLNKNNYAYNGLWFEVDKQSFIFDLMEKGKYIAFFVDDTLDNIKAVSDLKVQCYFLTQQLNSGSQYIKTIKSLKEIPLENQLNDY